MVELKQLEVAALIIGRIGKLNRHRELSRAHVSFALVNVVVVMAARSTVLRHLDFLNAGEVKPKYALVEELRRLPELLEQPIRFGCPVEPTQA